MNNNNIFDEDEYLLYTVKRHKPNSIFQSETIQIDINETILRTLFHIYIKDEQQEIETKKTCEIEEIYYKKKFLIKQNLFIDGKLYKSFEDLNTKEERDYLISKNL